MTLIRPIFYNIFVLSPTAIASYCFFIAKLVFVVSKVPSSFSFMERQLNATKIDLSFFQTSHATAVVSDSSLSQSGYSRMFFGCVCVTNER